VPDRRRRDELSSLLRQLRRDSGMSGVRAAKLAGKGISQPSISRYERGLFVPTVEDAATLADVYGAPPEARRKLVALVRDLRENATMPARVIMRRGLPAMQERIQRIEKASVRISTFCPVVVAGLLQTAAYAGTIFAQGGDVDPDEQAEALRVRLSRQGLLDDEHHQFTFVLAEGALRWPMGGPKVMAEQLEHLVAVSRKPSVRIGVVPWTGAVDLAPMHGFDLFDERAVVAATTTATAILTSAPDVAEYTKMFAELEALAVFGGEAREIVAGMAEQYRRPEI
jgi:transcriptional regulator with XRE-family HTH domain